MFLQVKRKLDLDSDHQYVSTSRPSIGQAPPSTPAPPRGTHGHMHSSVYSADFFLSSLPKIHSRSSTSAPREHYIHPIHTNSDLCYSRHCPKITAVLLSAQTTACQPVFVFTRPTSIGKNKNYWSIVKTIFILLCIDWFMSCCPSYWPWSIVVVHKFKNVRKEL